MSLILGGESVNGCAAEFVDDSKVRCPFGTAANLIPLPTAACLSVWWKCSIPNLCTSALQNQQS